MIENLHVEVPQPFWNPWKEGTNTGSDRQALYVPIALLIPLCYHYGK